ncbi:hypothetical protein SAMN04487825_10337 [Prevotella sp. kh1p2]|nr:hypothetical protein SAMN04487825_10337 [Prevotella sp. kh1p2]SNU10576.1 hypothetical protein SAMN06298210_103132 [Prevotellaceae bacterium KH2P17]
MPATVKVSRLYFFNITGFPAVCRRPQYTCGRKVCHRSGSCIKPSGST